MKPFTTPVTFGSFTGVYDVELIYYGFTGDADSSIGSSMEGNCSCLSCSCGLFMGDTDLSAATTG